MVAFVNQFTANVSPQYMSCVAIAEQFISSHWINPITITLVFDAEASGTGSPQSVDFPSATVSVSYGDLRGALIAHADNPDAQVALATLPATDPTAGYAGNHNWVLPIAYARMLGLSVAAPNDDGTIILNTSFAWSYGVDVIGVLEHEITEAAMGRVGGLGEQNAWSTLDLFRWSSGHFRDFTDGRDGQTTYFSVDGNTLLLPFHNQWSMAGRDQDDVGDFDALDVFGFGQNKGVAFSATDYKVMNVLGWTPPTITVGPLIVSASGDFDGNFVSDYIWRRPGDARMGMWSYSASPPLAQVVSAIDLGPVDFNWAVLGSGVFTPGATTFQMLMDYVPTGTMTLWWVNNGQLTGIDFGQRWSNVGFVAAGRFTNNPATGRNDFLVSNLVDHHLYDWWIGADNTLTGIDLGAAWFNVSLVATGPFTSNGIQNLLVSNPLDHHLYDWWIGTNNTLQGIDLGPAWFNVAYVGFGPPMAGHTSFLVSNTADHHLYDWWIGTNNMLQGIDLGPVWSNIQLIATGHFDNASPSGAEMLVRNTVDHHLYEWWISSQNQLAGIDLGPYWSNVQLIDHGMLNTVSADDQLLVRNTVDGHFYEWWIAFNQLQGIDLGAVGDAPGAPGSSAATAGAAPLATGAATTNGSGATPPAAPIAAPEPAPPPAPTMASPATDSNAPPTSADPASLVVRPSLPVNVVARGLFDGDSVPDYIWQRPIGGEMGMWSYFGATQTVTTTDLGTVDPSWSVIDSGNFMGFDFRYEQMLMDHVPTGTMTVWWPNKEGGVNGINLGQMWNYVGYIATGPFMDNMYPRTDFLVSNLTDHHLYDWWIGADRTLQGIDLGRYWSTVSLVATGLFSRPNSATAELLVSNDNDNHLYDWWISGGTLQGVDLGPYWGNLSEVATGRFTGRVDVSINDLAVSYYDDVLVSNTYDHHLYDWWIDPYTKTLQGIDLGLWSSTLQLVTTGLFDTHINIFPAPFLNTIRDEFLVQNTRDHHLYEWWIDNGRLTGIDLGPYWSNVQLIGHAHYNNNSPYDQLLVRNVVDGHLYEWWIANDQLQGVDLGPEPVAAASGSASSMAAAGAAPLASNAAAINGSGAISAAAPTPAAEPASPAGSTTASLAIDASLPSSSADSTSLIVRPPVSPVIVVASGDFDDNGIPDFIWRRPSDGEMGMWSYNGATQRVSTTDLGPVDFNWAILGDAHYTGSVGSTASQMLMDYVPNGTMTLWWVSNAQLTGINLGQRWGNIGFVATDPGHLRLSRPNDFLVSNLVDHHLYDWWVDANNTLQGVDLGPHWANVAFVGVGQFHRSQPSGDFLVANTVDHHLYDWWIDLNDTLQGIDLGPVWSNVAYVSSFWSPASLALDSFLVANTVDHHLYWWWIDFNNTLQGIDLGPHWSNVQLVAQFGRGEILVQNTVDHHLYEWWISSQNQLAGIDLGPYWANVQLVGHAHYNNNSNGEELLVRNTVDGHFYEWWIANNQLQGIDVTPDPIAVAGSGASSAPAAGAAPLATSAPTTSGGGAMSAAAPTSPAEPTPPAGSSVASSAMHASLPSSSADSTSLIVRPPASPVIVSASGDFDGNGIPDFIWRRPSDARMGMWSYNGATQRVSTTDLGTVDLNWVVLEAAHYSSVNGASGSQMLMDHVPDGTTTQLDQAPDGTMTLWWVTSQGQLAGIDLGQIWNNVAYVATGLAFNPSRGGAGAADFLVSNLTDHHLYDWKIDVPTRSLTGVDLGPYWSNVSVVTTGAFGRILGAQLLVSNTVDHHLYDWWISGSTLQGIDLGAYWSNVQLVATGNFDNNNNSSSRSEILVQNTVDHHLYDWWITPQAQLTGIDLGAYWSNVQLVAVDLFDNNVDVLANKVEMLVQNTVDHHLYEWWINSQHQLSGIDLGSYWSNVQLIGHAHYNESVPFPYSELLVRNTVDGHFYEWWIANNQLQGVDLGTDLVAVAGSSASSAAAADAAPLATSAPTTSGSGAMSAAAPTSSAEPTPPAGSSVASSAMHASLPSPSADSTSLIVRPPASPVIVSASGDFDNNGIPDFIWRRPSDAEMGMWSYNGATQRVSTTDLGPVGFNWAVLGGGYFNQGTQPTQMLMDYVPTGTMTLWWVNNGQLAGIDLGQRWINIGFVAAGWFQVNPPVEDFLVSNLTDHHLYDWWIGANNTLQGIDLGPHWTNVSLVATGAFTANGVQNVLVSNTIDHHLYDWYIDGSNRLEGIDLGPHWTNVSLFAAGAFTVGPRFTGITTTGGSDVQSLLVTNTVDHHLYDWWIGADGLRGIDFGPWFNVQFVTAGLFDDHGIDNTQGFSGEVLVQNTVDHHLYEWWVTPQGQLAGIDLGPYWANVQLVGHAHYNNNSNGEELLVRNTVDGDFYDWWIANNQLQGVDLGTDLVAVAGSNTSSAGAGAGNLAAGNAAALATSAATTSGSGALSSIGSTSVAAATSADDISASAPVIGPVTVVAAGFLDTSFGPRPDFVWTDSSGFMSIWEYDPSGVVPPILTFGLGATSGWAVLGTAHYSDANGAGGDQMLMDYVPTGSMTLWWADNGQLAGIDLGQRWANVGFVASAGPSTAPFNGTFGFQFGDFLVSNPTDHHLYDWWIGSSNTLQGVDLGPYWANVSLVATGDFTTHGNQNLLVSNSLDHHLYDWWITPQEQLAGIDLGPYWSNVAMVAAGNFTNNGGVGIANLLVTNVTDHHLYDWWIAANGTLQGVDLGPVWSNVALVATGQFRNNSTSEMLVQNTVDHHLYDWWITPQGQLTGIDLGPYWLNVQLIGHRHYNNDAPLGNEELLVHSTSDGHFYEWWIANNQLQGIDLGDGTGPGGPSNAAAAAGTIPLATGAATTSGSGAMFPVAPTMDASVIDASLPSLSSGSTSLLVQAMASFGTSGATLNSALAFLGGDPSQQTPLAASLDRHLAHS